MATASSTPSAPATLPSATQVGRTKVRDTGILQFQFECSLMDGERDRPARAMVWIGPAPLWEKDPRSSEADEDGDRNWGTQLLEDGRIAALGIKWDDFESDNPPRAWEGQHPEEIEVLRRLRSRIIDNLESSPDVKSIELKLGGNGQCQLDLDVNPCVDEAEGPFFVTMTFSRGERDRW